MGTGSVTVLIMAAGTGGHVFPALAIADSMRERAVSVEWLGTPNGMENRILQGLDIPLHKISVKGLRGNGLLRLLIAPLMLIRAFVQSFRVLGKVRPDFVLGMGGFVCGPAGLACRLRGIPLLIHEQNAVPGLTNKLLAPMAAQIFEAFPQTFNSRSRVTFTGNPLRKEFVSTEDDMPDRSAREGALKLLVLGGSQGATSINKLIPQLIASCSESLPLETLHQVGRANLESANSDYEENNIATGKLHRLVPFIDDVKAALLWADVVLCRSGASTVSEIAAMGCPAVFVPYPYHKDQQQSLNAQWLVKEDAALLLDQADLDVASLRAVLLKLVADRSQLDAIGRRARAMAVLDASERITDICLEISNVA